MNFRSLLFVPGARPERFEKAVASGADTVCIDLEDATPADKKEQSRSATITYLKSTNANKHIGVRINALETAEAYRDVAAFDQARLTPAFFLLPKVRTGRETTLIKHALAGEKTPVWVLMETPEALFNINDIAQSVGPSGGIMFGGADFSASIGSDMSWDALYQARASIIAAAAVAGCQAMDVPHLNVSAIDEMIEETRRVKAMGFTGRACIHPTQVAPVNDVFTPSTEEIEKAEGLIAAYDSARGVMLHDGRLVEKPVLAAAQRVLETRR